MINKLLKNKIFLTFFISIIVFGIIYLFSITLVNIDKSLSDKLYSNFTSEEIKVSKDIIILTIDDKSIKEIGSYPFLRNEYIPVINNLVKDKVSVIGLDIIFADKSIDKIDDEFSESIKKAGNIIIGGGILKNRNKNVFQEPYKKFKDSVLSYGYFRPINNVNNKKVYSINTYGIYENGRFFHFSIQVLRGYFKNIYGKNYLNYFKNNKNNFYITPQLKVPVKNGREFNINFSSLLKEEGIKEEKFTTFSFYDIYNNNYDHKLFKNKIIIIGYTAKGIKDIFFSPEGQKFGVYTHANIINTILTKQYKIYFDKNLEYLLIFLLIILSVYFNLSENGKNLLISNISIISIFIIIIYFIVDFQKTPLNFPAQFLFSLIITLTISNILKSFMEDKNKTLLNKALSQYVSKDIAQEILSGEGKVKIDGERKNISIFFSDIEGFTTISEKMEPEELVIFLREYLGAMSNIIMDERGFIDKYEGDAVMALWGVFGYNETSTYDNCISALKQQNKLKILNIDWKKRFGEELKIRMGINTGEAIIGNIGSEGRKMEFTALGDSVNLASRLEEVNKKYGTYLCVSEVVYENQKNNFDFRYLDKIKVKGKNIPVKIYELISKKGEISDFKKNIISEFKIAIDLYLGRNFEKAEFIFKKLINLGDNPSITYAERCLQFKIEPPKENWDGVWTMKSK